MEFPTRVIQGLGGLAECHRFSNRSQLHRGQRVQYELLVLRCNFGGHVLRARCFQLRLYCALVGLEVEQFDFFAHNIALEVLLLLSQQGDLRRFCLELVEEVLQPFADDIVSAVP